MTPTSGVQQTAFLDFELSEDQEALRDAARDLLDHHASPARVRAVVDDGGGFDVELWQAMVAQGWTGLLVSEESGGLGLGTVELAVLLEQVGAHTAPAPFLQQSVAIASLLSAVGLEPSNVDDLLSGERIAAIATRAVAASGAGDVWSLTGHTEPAVFAPSAHVAIVVGDTSEAAVGGGDDRDALFLVDLTDDLQPEPEPAMDRTRQLGWLRFGATPARWIGGAEAVAAFRDLAAMAYSAEMLGGAERVLAMSVDYAKERHQFGQPIGSFQAVKHRCADMLVDVEGMRSAVYYAAWAIGAGDVDASVAASTAKTWCSDASKRVHASALQVHGGIGFTWEHDLHFFLKRAQLDQLSFGDAAYHRTRLAHLLRARVESGTSVI